MNWNSTEFVWLDWAILAIGVIGVIWAVWHAIVKDRKAQKGEDSSAYLFGKGEPWYVIGMAILLPTLVLSTSLVWLVQVPRVVSVWHTGKCRVG